MDEQQQQEPVKVLSRIETKRLEREQKLEEQSAAERALKNEYDKVRENPAVLDIIAKVKAFSEMHLRISKDAAGYENQLDKDGNSSLVVTRLEPHERLRELDKSAGIDEIYDYIQRKLDL